MLFSSVTFFVFFTILLCVLAVLQRHLERKIVLLVASYVFYMWWNPAFILLIILSTLVDYQVGRLLDTTTLPARRKLLLILSLCTNLGILGVFKYTNFFQDNLLLFSKLLFGYTPSWPTINIILPVGISFYTFQTMSYTIDVYRRKLDVCHSLIDFSLFVSFFPQLVAGPIVRAADFLPQLQQLKRVEFQASSLFLFLRGLVKKIIIADNLGIFADKVFENPEAWPSAIIWVATICFSIQIYCDFSGYTDMAIAVARILGYQLPLNFDRPYFATDPSMFWRKWHISLSSWLRDYLYIPLGGNRHGNLARYRNLMATMLLGGLWHGASWNFVLWGFLHGGALAVHQGFLRSVKEKWPFMAKLDSTYAYPFACFVVFQLFVLTTWIPFRLTSSAEMLIVLSKFLFFDFNFRLSNIGVGNLSIFSTALLIGAFAACHVYSRFCGDIDVQLAKLPLAVGWLVCVLIGLTLVLFWPTSETPFIYFQF